MLYVTESLAGRLTRVDPQTGATDIVASGLPPALIGVGGAMDVAFLDGTAYVLVSLVGDFGGGVDGIYRVDGPSTFTVIADLGAFSAANPPATPFDLPSGVQYAIESHRSGFLVTDGHHNRVLGVSKHGEISVLRSFENIVPTGLDVSGNTVFLAQAGPAPHEPKDGRIVEFELSSSEPALTAASGGRLLVDVEFGRGRKLYALAQGIWDQAFPGSPAIPNTGSLLEVDANGGFAVLEEWLDRPTSLELIGNTAYVVTLSGQILKFESLSAPPFGRPN